MHVLYNQNFVYKNAREEALQVPRTSFVDLHGLGPAFKSPAQSYLFSLGLPTMSYCDRTAQTNKTVL